LPRRLAVKKRGSRTSYVAVVCLPLWPAQAALLTELYRGNVREAVWCLGRRSGKDRMASVVAARPPPTPNLTWQRYRRGSRSPFYGRNVRLPNHRGLIAELLSLGQHTLPSGRPRFGAPPGGSDEYAHAVLALAHHLMAQPVRGEFSLIA
jgi:hypothetical protein